MSAERTDPRTDAPNGLRHLVVTVPQPIAPAFDRVLSDARRRNPKASDAQLVEQIFVEFVILMDARLPCGAEPYFPRVGSNPDEDA